MSSRIVDALPVHIAVVESSGRIIRVNHAWQDFARANGAEGSPAVAAGANYIDVCRRAADASDQSAAMALAGIQAVLSGEQRQFIHEYPCHSPQEQRWFHMTVVPFGNGDYRGAVITHANITERREAEVALRNQKRQLALAMDAGRLVPWEIDLITGEVVHAQRLFELFGIMPDARLQTRDQWRMLIHEDDRPRLFHAVEQAKAGGEHHTEYRIRHPDGTIHWHESHGITVDDARGRNARLIGFARDITGRKRAEASLQDAKAAAESATRAKDQFIAVLSHELRTPLTPVVAALAMVRTDERLPADLREDIEMISNNVDVQVRLIADLLDISRITSGKIDLDQRPMDLAETIREAASVIRAELEAKKQTLAIEMPGAPYLMYGDPDRLQQVFWNLLRNSIKFSPERSQIVIRARVVPLDTCPLAAQPCPVGRGQCPSTQANADPKRQRGANLIIDVIDQGCGIDPEMLPRVFGAFEQEQKSRGYGGLGLGLSICKGLVEMHNGSISANSEGVGHGATFTIKLPVAQCAKPEYTTAPVKRATPPATPPPPMGQSLHILLVEDHVDTAKLLRRLLQTQGHKVQIARSVAEGLAAAETNRPDLLISDLGLADGSGLDLMKKLIERGIRLPAIALSGYGALADVQNSRNAGFAEHLIKPLQSLDVLNAAIARLMASARDNC